MVKLKRAYEKAAPQDGTRFLVERLWPRGIKKTDLQIDAWLKDVAPSDTLRRWFALDPEKWPEFRRRYFEGLDRNPEVREPICSAARRTAGSSEPAFSSASSWWAEEFLEARKAKALPVRSTSSRFSRCV